MAEREHYRDRNGKRVQATRYRMRFLDARGKRRQLRLFKDRRGSEAFERRVHRCLAAAKGGETLDPEMLRWVSDMDGRTRDKLIQWGVIDARRIPSARLLEDHIAAWTLSLRARANTPQHIKETTARVRKILRETLCTRWHDIDVDAMREWLERASGEKGFGVRRYNGFVQSLRQFGKWMVVSELAPESPFVRLEQRSMGSEPKRRVRRAATPDEARRLLAFTTASEKAYRGMEGIERAMLYRTALYTGLRGGELRKLRVFSIQWAADSRPGVIQLAASDTKAGLKTGREDLVVLRSSLELQLRNWLGDRPLDAAVFPNLTHNRYAEMLRRDMDGAGVDWKDGAGRVLDFHALRHTIATWVGFEGTDMTTHKAIMRHSTVELTMRYSHAEQGGMRSALESVPDVESGPEPPETDLTTYSTTHAAAPRHDTLQNGPEGPQNAVEGGGSVIQNPLTRKGLVGSSPTFGTPPTPGDSATYGGDAEATGAAEPEAPGARPTTDSTSATAPHRHDTPPNEGEACGVVVSDRYAAAASVLDGYDDELADFVDQWTELREETREAIRALIARDGVEGR